MQDVQVLEIVCGIGGLNYSQAIGNYPIHDLRDAQCITVEEDTWQKEGGSQKINSTAISSGASITGLWDFWPSSSTQKLLAGTSDGKIVSFGPSGVIDTLASSLGSDRIYVFVEALGASSTRKLFIFNGYDAVRVTSNGVSASTIANPPSDWSGTNQPVAGVSHNGRLWGFGNANDPHRVYYSTLTNHEDFTGSGSGSLSVYPGEGERLVAGFSFAGRLFLFKYPRGIYWVDDSSPTLSEWKIKRLTRAIGMAGPLGIAQVDNDVVFVSSEGLIHALTTVQEYGDAKASAILPEKLSNFVAQMVNVSRLDRASAIYYPAKKQWQLAYTAKGYNVNNRRLILDLHDMQNPRFTYSSLAVCESLALMRDSNGVDRPMAGDNAGFVRTLDQESRSHDGAGFTAKFETPDIDVMPKGIRRGNLQYIEAVFRPKGSHNLTVDIYRDGIFSETVYLSMGTAAAGTLGSFVLGSNILGGGDILNRRRRISGDCRRIKLVAYNSGLGENFSIASFLIGYTPGNERI